MMRKFATILTAALIPVTMFSQAQLTTKKAELEDFSEKVTKVVLTGNLFLDSELENAVKDNWRLSPYEFCSVDDFNALKGSSDYYFLTPVSAQFRKEAEPGLTMLTLLKGGKGSDKSIDKMFEVVSVPLCSAENPSGREMSFLPALVDIVQAHAAASMEKESKAYSGLRANARLSSLDSPRIVFALGDLKADLNDPSLPTPSDLTVSAVPDEDADRLMEEMPENTVVSYVVCPTDAQPNSYCYLMLVDARTHRLYYCRKYRITKKSGTGFQREDLLRILK